MLSESFLAYIKRLFITHDIHSAVSFSDRLSIHARCAFMRRPHWMLYSYIYNIYFPYSEKWIIVKWKSNEKPLKWTYYLLIICVHFVLQHYFTIVDHIIGIENSSKGKGTFFLILIYFCVLHFVWLWSNLILLYAIDFIRKQKML